MSHAHHDPIVPRGALIGAAALLCFTMALTGAARLGLVPKTGDPAGTRAAEDIAPAATRSLRFSDRADGAVVISDARSGGEVMVVPYGQGGFIRATLRRLAKARVAGGVGAEPPFTLVRWENGSMTLQDPATGKSAEIHGFGPDHSRAFNQMLTGPAA
jgi:putative photosynthetic complex assembly protein